MIRVKIEVEGAGQEFEIQCESNYLRPGVDLPGEVDRLINQARASMLAALRATP